MIPLLERLLLRPTDSTLVQLLRYTFVGGLAFIVDLGSLFALTEFAGLHYLVSASLSFLLGLATNYTLSTWWIFTQRTIQSRTLEFLIFGGIGLIGLGINDLCMWSMTELAGVHYLLSKIASTAVVFLWNFFARKYSLFNKGKT